MNKQQPQNLDELAGKIASLLDEGTRQIDAPVSAKLLAVRKEADRKSTRLNSSHVSESRMPSSA